jgi:hypothetical protein
VPSMPPRSDPGAGIVTWPGAAHLEDLVERFRARTLPKDEWTHRAHLAVGAWHVRAMGPERALEALREGIHRLNDAHGTISTKDSGYHETITRAYVLLIADVISACEGRTAAECVQAVWSSPVAQKGALLHYYSESLLQSSTARCGWVEPDRRPLPRPVP